LSRRSQKLFFSIGGGLLAVAVVVSLALSHVAIAHQMHAWKLLPEPERLTELYFTDHTKLPNLYYINATQTVSFTVHNLEYQNTAYTYKIVQQSEDGKTQQPLGSGGFTLPQNGYQKTVAVVAPIGLGSRSKISVLLSTNESISYWVTEGGV
jgi:hypothetical protein